MITKPEAKKWVYNAVVSSLRKFSTRLKPTDISSTATEKDVEKVKAVMDEEAKKLGIKYLGET